MITPFGAVQVVTPGVPVSAASNLTLATGQNVPVQSLLFQALPNNSGIVYIQLTPEDDRSTLRYMVALLPPPTDPATGPFPSAAVGMQVVPAGLNLRSFYIDADNANDGVIISGTTG